MSNEEILAGELIKSARLAEAVAASCTSSIAAAAKLVVNALQNGGRVFLAGNGGSAADAQHLAAELVGRFRRERPGLPVIALTTNTSVLTAVANDYGYETVFSRQVAALAGAGDLVILLSTSGNSPNIISAAEEARRRGISVIGLTGRTGGALGGFADIMITIPSDDTPRIQGMHITVGHIICDLVETSLT